MSKQTILDLQKDSVLIGHGSGRGAKLSLDQVSYQGIGENADGNDIKFEEAVHKAVAAIGAKGDVTVIASRESVEVRTLMVPRIDADELPDVIRFQAQRQMSGLNDNWSIDYVMLPPSPGQEMQTALVGGISPAAMAEIERTCAGAGLNITRILLRPIEIARFAIEHGSLTTTGVTMIVCVTEKNADLLLMRDGHVIQVRGTRLPSEPEQTAASLKGEIRRSLMAASSQLAGTPVSDVLLVATSTLATQLDAVISEAAGAPVTYLDPTNLLPNQLANRDSIASAAGHRLAAMAGAVVAESANKSGLLDFKNPKKRPPKKKNTGRILLYGGAVAALLLIGIGWWWMQHRALDQEIAHYQAQTAERAEQVKWAEEKIKEFSSVQGFLLSSPNWLDELAYVAERTPAADKIIFDKPLTLTVPQRGSDGTIIVSIRANDATTIGTFEKSISDEHHVVRGGQSKQISNATGNYKWSVSETITVKGRGWNPFAKRESKASSNSETKKDPAEPAAETPAADTAVTQAVETQAVETQASETTSAETPATESPAAETSAAETPTAETTTAETPVPATPAADSTETASSEGKEPAEEQPVPPALEPAPAEAPSIDSTDSTPAEAATDATDTTK
ncbi:MAG: hypothetical protein R3C53_03995 [Pirellulaceae bacterium]